MKMGSRWRDEDIQRILEDSEDENDFSDGSDEMYQPVEDEDSENNQEESLSDIEREVFRITSRRRQEQIPVSEPSTSFFDGNDRLDTEHRIVSENELEHDSLEDENVLQEDRQQHHHNQEEWVEDILPIGRQPFTGKAGIQNIQAIKNEEGVVSIPNIVEFFINEDIIDNMIAKTNAYAAILKQVRTKQFSRMSRWVDVDRREMKKFFAVILYMGIDKKPSIEHYWKMDPLYYTPFIHEVGLSYNRFSTILRCWHFADVQPDNDDVLYRIQPLVEQLIGKFRELYVPGDTIVVDESQINHQGRLHIKTYNPAKTHKYGIKIYKMCATNSYTWSYAIHAGSGTVLEGLDKPGTVVAKLCLPLLNEGRLVVADNYYTGLGLAKYLKDRQTDLCGTLRKNKRGLPDVVTKKKLKRGDVVARQMDSYVTVLKWHDKRDVLMISTCHDDGMTNVSSWRGETSKPNMVIDYNDAKKGIDVADQLCSYYSPLRKSLTWYKKIAVDLLFQAVLVNTRVVFLEATGCSVGILNIQEAMIRHWLGDVVQKKQNVRLSTGNPRRHHLSEIPRRDGKIIRRRCVRCYAQRKEEGQPCKAKQVHTECLECGKAYCLECYNEMHK